MSISVRWAFAVLPAVLPDAALAHVTGAFNEAGTVRGRDTAAYDDAGW